MLLIAVHEVTTESSQISRSLTNFQGVSSALEMMRFQIQAQRLQGSARALIQSVTHIVK